MALVVVGVLEATGFVRASVPIAIALTTTALAPSCRFCATTTCSPGAALLSLATIGGLALAFTFVPRLIRGRRAEEIMMAGEHATSQTTLRWSIVLLLALLALAARVGLDVVLGAFLAGVVLRQWSPGNVRTLEQKLDVVGYGFFIPIFFVSSGMTLDVRSILEAPLRLLVFLVLLLAVRGLPALLVYRHALSPTQRAQMTFITATRSWYTRVSR